MRISQDGNMYCVQADSFTNLQESQECFFIKKDEYLRFIQAVKNGDY